MAVSFANDIAPMFKPFDVNMAWRFGLTTYDDVKANAMLIYSRMTNLSSPMPPLTPCTSPPSAPSPPTKLPHTTTTPLLKPTLSTTTTSDPPAHDHPNQ